MNEIQKGDEIALTVRTADQTRRAAVDVSPEQTAAEVIQAAAENWSLPTDTDYTLVNVTTGRTLAPGESLAAGVRPGDTLEVQPVLVAGS